MLKTNLGRGAVQRVNQQFLRRRGEPVIGGEQRLQQVFLRRRRGQLQAWPRLAGVLHVEGALRLRQASPNSRKRQGLLHSPYPPA